MYEKDVLDFSSCSKDSLAKLLRKTLNCSIAGQIFHFLTLNY